MADRDVKIDIVAEDNTGRATRSAARNFEKLEKDTSKVVQGLAGVATSIAEKLGSSISGAVESAGPQVQAAIGAVVVAGAVAAAPLIGAAISGAIIGGIGLGGVVGGFVLAAKDERVQAAFADLKTSISNELKDAATPFIDVSLKGISQVGAAVKGINFKQIFADSARNATPLIDGVTDAVTELGAAIANVIHNAGPVLSEIGREISSFGHTVADGLNSIADNGKEGADALHQLFIVINGSVSAVFSFVNGLTEVYGALQKISGGGGVGVLDAIGEASAHVANKTQQAAQGAIASAAATSQFGQAAGSAAGPIQTFTDKVNAAANSNRSLFDSTTNVGEALNRTAEAARQNGKTLDANTEKGRANRTALSNLASALVAQYNATVQVNGEGIKSNSVAAQNRSAFIRQAQAFGLSRDAAARLASEMGLIPAKKNTNFYANTHDAVARVQALKEQIGSVSGKTVKINVDYAYRTFGKPATSISPYGARGFSASTFASAGESNSVNRTGGPNEITQNINDIQVFVDNQPVRAEIREAQRQMRYERLVGRRYA